MTLIPKHIREAFDRSIAPVFGPTDIRTQNMRANFAAALIADEMAREQEQSDLELLDRKQLLDHVRWLCATLQDARARNVQLCEELGRR